MWFHSLHNSYLIRGACVNYDTSYHECHYRSSCLSPYLSLILACKLISLAMQLLIPMLSISISISQEALNHKKHLSWKVFTQLSIQPLYSFSKLFALPHDSIHTSWCQHIITWDDKKPLNYCMCNTFLWWIIGILENVHTGIDVSMYLRM